MFLIRLFRFLTGYIVFSGNGGFPERFINLCSLNGISLWDTKCSAGKYSGSGAASCSTCVAGTYSAAGSSSCTKCKAGEYSGVGAGSCITCPAGKYSTSEGNDIKYLAKVIIYCCGSLFILFHFLLFSISSDKL